MYENGCIMQRSDHSSSLMAFCTMCVTRQLQVLCCNLRTETIGKIYFAYVTRRGSGDVRFMSLKASWCCLPDIYTCTYLYIDKNFGTVSLSQI